MGEDRNPAARIRRSLQGRGAAAPLWWFAEHGRERFEREMRADGVAPAEAAEILSAFDRELRPQLLDVALERLRRRVASP
jgi:hypothetical protein